MKKIRKFLGLSAALLLTVSVIAQKPVLLDKVESHILTASQSKFKYKINVILPSGYQKKDSLHYPVLYALDGQYATTTFYALKETIGLAKELKDVIIVTIDREVNTHNDWLSARHYDLTPSYDPATDKAIATFLKLDETKFKSGGAAAFLHTLEVEIIPMVEKKYKVTSERSIFGHSLGGLFASYCLLQKPQLFQKYSINSPSFWWKNGEMQAMFLNNKNFDTKAILYMSVAKPEGDFMLKPFHAFVDAIKANYKNITFSTQIFEDESHVSAAPLASSKTLKLFYPAK